MKRIPPFSLKCIAGVILPLLFGAASLSAQYHLINDLAVPVEEAFDGLGTGDADISSALPNWQIQEGGTSLENLPGNTGILLSSAQACHFGGSSSQDRALGGYGVADDNDYYFAWRFTNQSGDAISKIHLKYVQELWIDRDAEEGFQLGLVRITDPESPVDLSQATIESLDNFDGEGFDYSSTLTDILQAVTGRSDAMTTNEASTWMILDDAIEPGESFMLVWTDENNGSQSEDGIGFDDIQLTFFSNRWYLSDEATTHNLENWTPYPDGDLNVPDRPYFIPEEWSSITNRGQSFVIDRDFLTNSNEDITLPSGDRYGELRILPGVTFTWYNLNADLNCLNIALEDSAELYFLGNKTSQLGFESLGNFSTVRYGSQKNNFPIPFADYYNLVIDENGKTLVFPDSLYIRGQFEYFQDQDKIGNMSHLIFTGTNSVINVPSFAGKLDLDLVVENGSTTTFNQVPENDEGIPTLELLSVNVRNGGTFIIPSGKAVNIESSLVNNGTIEISDDAILLQENTTANTGNGVYKATRAFASNDEINPNLGQLHYVSSPVSGTTIGPNGSGADLTAAIAAYFYDGLYQGVYPTPVIINSAEEMVPGQGYLVQGGVTSTTDEGALGFTTTGSNVNNGEVLYPITNVFGISENDHDGLHGYTVGNPYPSPISVKAFLEENASGNNPLIQGAIYMYSSYLNTISGDIRFSSKGLFVVNYAGTSLPPQVLNSADLDTDLDDYHINAFQGFGVKSAHPTGGNLVFNNDMRIGTDNGSFKAGENPVIESRFWIALNTATQVHYTTMVFSPQASLGYENLLDYNNELNLSLDVWTMSKNTAYEINSVPPIDSLDKFIPLGFYSEETGKHILSLSFAEQFPVDKKIMLLDVKENISHNLSESAYAFQVNSSETNQEINDRFFLFFEDAGAVGVNENTPANNFKLLIHPNSLIVYADNVVQAELLTLDGRRVALAKAEEPGIIRLNHPTSNGLYIIRVSDTRGGYMHTMKVKL